METEQRPPKRVRKHSSSSASDSNQPTKAPREEKNEDDPSHSQQPIEQPNAQESSDGESSDVEASQDGKKDSNSHQTSLESTNQELESSLTESNNQSNSIQGDTAPVVYSNGDWQAVYDPASKAYYFANSKTGEATWTNPMMPPEPTPSRPAHSQQLPDLGGIDPELARLDPHFSKLIHGHSSSSEPRFTARFNAKTGRFESDPSHDPSRVSEFARARTQAEAFFDVAGWEKSLENHNGRIPGTSKEARAAAIEKGKKLTKAQLEQFKKQKMEKKARNQRAWLIGSK